MATVENTTIDVNKPVFPISVVAEQLSVHPRTLRIYDEEGILKPSRSAKNRRLYSMNDINKGHFIQFMTRDLGINLAGIKVIFELTKDKDGAIPSEFNTYEEYRKDWIKNIADKIGITADIRHANNVKLSHRGRKRGS